MTSSGSRVGEWWYWRWRVVGMEVVSGGSGGGEW